MQYCKFVFWPLYLLAVASAISGEVQAAAPNRVIYECQPYRVGDLLFIRQGSPILIEADDQQQAVVKATYIGHQTNHKVNYAECHPV